MVLRFQAGIWRYLRAMGATPSEADDLTQDTFVAVLQRGFEHYGNSATKAYLRRCARNFFISLKRRQGREVVSEDLELFDRTWEQWSKNDNGEDALSALKDCFEQLTERARQALSLRFRDKQTRAFIAEELAISEHGAKNLMQRAKQKLRDCVLARLQGTKL
ncbi:MAG TPA: sigma-70 family RNA polymerase sigma factor [Planctomycetes bacterium]|nr:sigma-70 family RNA polymerase sigma factor [Planctomycetaceae bacterium]HIM31950.1 sigma-70 family RNA polymerase sigma factor [Planctomycetota bacterium]